MLKIAAHGWRDKAMHENRRRATFLDTDSAIQQS
jgi:hypothetical protein